MNNQVNEVLEKIRDVCPELKELSIGAKVKLETLDLKNNIYNYAYFCMYTEDEMALLSNGKKYGITWAEEQVIGLPVQLNHLLLAVSEFGYLLEKHDGYEHGYSRIEKIISMYDLQKSVEDNLRSNPKLTKWVHGVIIGKE